MTLSGQVAVFAEESQPFTAKDGVIDEQEGDVFYEIFVRAFRDSNGDHIGDFKGIEEQIPYLADLGITGIWLMPITDSGSEHGYDVRDYYEVNSDYGTMEDFQSMLATCHEYGIKVIMDLVVNHCSWSNVWFQEALQIKHVFSTPFFCTYSLPPYLAYIFKTIFLVSSMKGILSENSSIVDVVFLHVKRSLLVYIAIFQINIMVLFVHYVHIQTFYYKKTTWLLLI